MPNGIVAIAKNQITDPPTLPALSSITPDMTMAIRKVRSAIPITKTPMKYAGHEARFKMSYATARPKAP